MSLHRISTERSSQLKAFISKNELPISSIKLLDVAFTHKSYANEIWKINPPVKVHNQRLEFLGDAVLGNIIAEEVYKKQPGFDEGKLTQKKSQVVCEATLVEIGNTLEISSLLQMGKGEVLSGGGDRSSMIADAVEALFGAIFIETGYVETRKFILGLCEPYLEGENLPEKSIDYKSSLQEYLVQKDRSRPEYQVLKIQGPEHEKTFLVGLYINGKKVAEAEGKSKKKAEQNAAQFYLQKKALRVKGF